MVKRRVAWTYTRFIHTGAILENKTIYANTLLTSVIEDHMSPTYLAPRRNLKHRGLCIDHVASIGFAAVLGNAEQGSRAIFIHCKVEQVDALLRLYYYSIDCEHFAEDLILGWRTL
jgi:hypothetical protein